MKIKSWRFDENSNSNSNSLFLGVLLGIPYIPFKSAGNETTGWGTILGEFQGLGPHSENAIDFNVTLCKMIITKKNLLPKIAYHFSQSKINASISPTVIY